MCLVICSGLSSILTNTNLIQSKQIKTLWERFSRSCQCFNLSLSLSFFFFYKSLNLKQMPDLFLLVCLFIFWIKESQFWTCKATAVKQSSRVSHIVIEFSRLWGPTEYAVQNSQYWPTGSLWFWWRTLLLLPSMLAMLMVLPSVQ